MSAIQKRLTTAALHALGIIGDLAENFGGAKGENASKVLATISAIVQSVSNGLDRTIDPAEVLKQIEASLASLETDIAQNNKSADAELDEKFPPTESPSEPSE